MPTRSTAREPWLHGQSSQRAAAIGIDRLVVERPKWGALSIGRSRPETHWQETAESGQSRAGEFQFPTSRRGHSHKQRSPSKTAQNYYSPNYELDKFAVSKMPPQAEPDCRSRIVRRPHRAFRPRHRPKQDSKHLSSGHQANTGFGDNDLNVHGRAPPHARGIEVLPQLYRNDILATPAP